MGYPEVYVVEVKADFSVPLHVMAQDREDAEHHVLETFAGDYKVVDGMNDQSYDFDQFSIEAITKRDDQSETYDSVTPSGAMQEVSADNDGSEEQVVMDFRQKAFILCILWMDYKEEMASDPHWLEYMTHFDLGLPLAYMYTYHVVEGEPTELGKVYVISAWEAFCELLSIDPDGSYGNLGECWEASPNEPIQA